MDTSGVTDITTVTVQINRSSSLQTGSVVDVETSRGVMESGEAGEMHAGSWTGHVVPGTAYLMLAVVQTLHLYHSYYKSRRTRGELKLPIQPLSLHKTAIHYRHPRFHILS